jgi:hypothetical protein
MRRVQVIIVIVMVLFLLGVALTFLSRNQGRAAQTNCAENLRRLGMAIYMRAELQPQAVLDGKVGLTRAHTLPAARITEGYATWAVQLAPFLKAESQLSGWDLGLPFIDQAQPVRDAAVPLFLCPARSRSAFVFAQEEDGKTISGAVGDYACASGDGDPEHDWSGPKANGAIIEGEVDKWDGKRIVKWHSRTNLADLQEDGAKGFEGRGLSYTIFLGEKHVPMDALLTLAAGDGSLYDGRHPACYARAGGKGYPLASGPDAPFNSDFGSYHPGFCHFLFADTKVQQTSVAISPEVLGELIRR